MRRANVESIGRLTLDDIHIMRHIVTGKAHREMGFYAGPTRIELATSCVTGRRSNQAELRPQIINNDKLMDNVSRSKIILLQEN